MPTHADRRAPLLTLLRRSLYLGAGSRRWPWVLVVLLAVVVSAIEALGALLIFVLLSLVATPDYRQPLPVVGDVRDLIGGDDDQVLTVAAIAVAVFFVGRGVVVLVASYVQARVTQSAGARLATRLHASYMRMPYSLYVATNSSTQIRNIGDTVQRVVTDVFVQGARLVSECVVMLVLGVLLVVASPTATALLVGTMGPAALFVNRFAQPRLTRLGDEAQRLAGDNLKMLQESLHGLRDIRLLGRESHFVQSFAWSRAALARNRQARSVLQQLPATTVETAFVLFISALLVVTVAAGDSAADIVPVVGMFAYVGLRLKPSLNQILTSLNGVRYSAAAIDDLYDDLQRAEQWVDDEVEADRVMPLPFERALVLEDVCLTYDGADEPALRDITLTIPVGASVGLVGPTGGGKSTLIDVITGLLQPDAGRVLVDGQDVRTVARAWQRKLGIVPQTIFLVDDTLRRNIALGERDDGIDEVRLRNALRLAQLDRFLATLPAGLETVLGERGIRVSGGERQRIGIARALYRTPEVLVLDEGTSALDNRTEAELMAAVEQLRGRYTLLVVAHRLSTVRRCDAVHVIEAGRIVASGTYQELVENSDHFRRLATEPGAT